LKKVFGFLLILLLLTGLDLTGSMVASAELPPEHRARYEAAKAEAIANVRNRLPGQAQLFAEARGDFNGYTGSKSDNSLRVEYTLTDSIIAMGEPITCFINMYCMYPPMDYVISGMYYNEQFDYIADIVEIVPSEVTFDTEISIECPITSAPEVPGYFNFIIYVIDGNGNYVALTTSTVRVYEADEPLFSNWTIDNDLIMTMDLDRSQLKVGEFITAAMQFSTQSEPFSYRGAWTLKDENGNVLDTYEFYENDVYLGDQVMERDIKYQPLQAGKLQLTIEVDDAAGNQVKSNTPVITVQDGFYPTARLNRQLYVNAGNELTATYEIHGHQCSDCHYYCGWICYDETDGTALVTQTQTLKERSGKVSFTPRIGREIEFYVGASCRNVPSAYPANQTIPIVGGLLVDMELDAATVSYGNTIGMTYTADGGKTPYARIVISGYTYDRSRDKTYQFMTRTLTDAAGAVSGLPRLGDEIYFTMQLVEADGNITTWTSERATLTGAPEVTDLMLAASLDSAEVAVGKPITLTYEMTGGSDTLNKTEDNVSYVSWKKADGTVVKKENLTDDDGTASFTPTEEGSYYCELVLTDSYRQQISWKSGIFTAVANMPGDADADGDVDIYDVMLVLQYCAGWSVSPNRDNADVDGSGRVNMADAVRIVRYCTGENVTLE